MMDLNPQQQLAVQHTDGPMLVLAGAGSGKTRVITYRIAYLLSIGVPSSELLALTFTNKAAREMKERIQSLSKQSVLTTTFHSLGALILRESIDKLGYKNDFTIYDADDSLQLLKASLASMGYKQDKATVKSFKTAISKVKNALLSSSDLSRNNSSPQDKLLKDVFSCYQNKLKEYNALDFDDLLYLSVQLFDQYPETLAIYQQRWSFVSIDEYQDTNRAQYAMIKRLTAKHGNLFVVGDPDQSIYSWRGANFQHILDFERDCPGAKTISLEQNYRSTTNILDGANGLIKHNGTRYEKTLWSSLGPGEKIGIYIAENERKESRFVIETLQNRLEEEQVPLHECVIFYRTNAQSRPFEDFLLQTEIPYTIIGGISFYQRREIKDILAFLRVAISPSDFLSFSRTVNLPKRGIGRTTLQKWQQAAENDRLPILSFCQTLLTEDSPILSLSAKQKEGLKEYLAIIDALQKEERENGSLETLLTKAIEYSRYLDFLKEDPDTFEERRENLSELIAKGKEWEIEREQSSLASFLEELSLHAQSGDSSSKDSIRLMTLHNGKGLEFHTVFIVGLEEDLLPHVNAKSSEEALEEERRLLYVGMTRAKNSLYLSASTYRSIWGISKIMRPSRFLEEIPPPYRSQLNQVEDIWEEKLEELPEGHQVGTIVIHRDFGKGTVKKVYQTSLGTTYDVYFPDKNMTRSLIGKYAKFTVLPQ